MPSTQTVLRVPIDDETLTRLQQRADRLRMDLERVTAHLLKIASQQLPVDNSRAVLVSGPDLEILESIFQGGSLLHGQDLRQKVERLAGISFLHCRLPFTPNQLEALAEKATRNGLSVDQLVERTAPRIYEHFFDLIARV